MLKSILEELTFGPVWSGSGYQYGPDMVTLITKNYPVYYKSGKGVHSLITEGRKTRFTSVNKVNRQGSS